MDLFGQPPPPEAGYGPDFFYDLDFLDPPDLMCPSRCSQSDSLESASRAGSTYRNEARVSPRATAPRPAVPGEAPAASKIEASRATTSKIDTRKITGSLKRAQAKYRAKQRDQRESLHREHERAQAELRAARAEHCMLSARADAMARISAWQDDAVVSLTRLSHGNTGAGGRRRGAGGTNRAIQRWRTLSAAGLTTGQITFLEASGECGAIVQLAMVAKTGGVAVRERVARAQREGLNPAEAALAVSAAARAAHVRESKAAKREDLACERLVSDGPLGAILATIRSRPHAFCEAELPVPVPTLLERLRGVLTLGREVLTLLDAAVDASEVVAAITTLGEMRLRVLATTAALAAAPAEEVATHVTGTLGNMGNRIRGVLEELRLTDGQISWLVEWNSTASKRELQLLEERQRAAAAILDAISDGLEPGDLSGFSLGFSSSRAARARRTFAALERNLAMHQELNRARHYTIFRVLTMYQRCRMVASLFTLPFDTLALFDEIVRSDRGVAAARRGPLQVRLPTHATESEFWIDPGSPCSVMDGDPLVTSGWLEGTLVGRTAHLLELSGSEQRPSPPCRTEALNVARSEEGPLMPDGATGLPEPAAWTPRGSPLLPGETLEQLRRRIEFKEDADFVSHLILGRDVLRGATSREPLVVAP